MVRPLALLAERPGAAFFEALRSLVVTGSALALIAAGRALPPL